MSIISDESEDIVGSDGSEYRIKLPNSPPIITPGIVDVSNLDLNYGSEDAPPKKTRTIKKQTGKVKGKRPTRSRKRKVESSSDGTESEEIVRPSRNKRSRTKKSVKKNAMPSSSTESIVSASDGAESEEIVRPARNKRSSTKKSVKKNAVPSSSTESIVSASDGTESEEIVRPARNKRTSTKKSVKKNAVPSSSTESIVSASDGTESEEIVRPARNKRTSTKKSVKKNAIPPSSTGSIVSANDSASELEKVSKDTKPTDQEVTGISDATESDIEPQSVLQNVSTSATESLSDMEI
jgi:hypothetical protein